MPNVDVQWPSEDEDFDAVSTPDVITNSVTGASSDLHSRQTVAPRAVQVQDQSAVSDEPSEPDEAPADNFQESPVVDDDQPAEAPAAKVTAAAAQTPEEVPAASDEYEPSAVPEATAAAEPEASVAPAEATKPAKASKPPKAARANGGRNYVHYAVEAVLLLALIGVGFYAYSLQGDKKDLKTQVSELNANPQVAVQKQTQTLINSVGALMQLPTNETPTIANVSDAAQAKQQSAFFNNAQNGDKVLMYVKAGEAILYRPSTNRIVLVAPLTFSNTATK